MSEELGKLSKVTLNKETIDVLVANVIPTTKYFEFRFDTMQKQFDHFEEQNNALRQDMDKRFEQVEQRFNGMQEYVDKRFEQVDKRFEQVDKRFEQVDKRFDQVIASVNRLTDTLENRDADQRTITVNNANEQRALTLNNANEQRALTVNNANEQRAFTLKMFMISISLSVLGVLGIILKVAGVFK